MEGLALLHDRWQGGGPYDGIHLGPWRYSAAGNALGALSKLPLIGVYPPDWNDSCTPWPAPGLRKKDRAFGGGASETLSFLVERLLPWARSLEPIPASGPQLMLAGYSLAGLTCLYGLYQGMPFGRFASLSGSLWYPGWTEYALRSTAPAAAQVYLSLARMSPAPVIPCSEP